MIRRIYVEKKEGFNVEAKYLSSELKENLGISLNSLRILNRYDVEGINEETYNKAKPVIFSEPAVDTTIEENINFKNCFAVEYLPGQYDQRADSAAQCLQAISESEDIRVATARVYVFEDSVSKEDVEKIKNYIINPIESREADLNKPETLVQNFSIPTNVETIKLIDIEKLHEELSLAMTIDDLKCVQKYFNEEEKRDPTITEIKVLDTYWSDHCRHTTFLTEIKDINIEYKPIKQAMDSYIDSRKNVYGDRQKDICLMDIATIAMKELKKQGKLNDLDESDEINACSIKVDIKVDGEIQKWLVMFKNETHNHPTEIEPFGGSATCLGGAIRDPLSGRSYVYQSMRITGSGNPCAKIEDTIKGKLPQRTITKGAAHGFSSYGNQIGLATGHVEEVYHEGFVAKRMELGAVIGATPFENVVRETPKPSDKIILIGGRTGRDGCGGATGSSKEHNEDSMLKCGAEVQKGNAPTERKIQRLFRNKDVAKLIKKCNDFGAGGVAVAVGELADGLDIDLDAVPKKYEGLDGTELAISESQERMAVVIAEKDVLKFIEYVKTENLESTIVATVTEEKRLKMTWNKKVIVDISRAFLDTNGAKQVADAIVTTPDLDNNYFDRTHENLKEVLSNLNVCSQQGLVELFDNSIGAGTVLMPFGGKYALTPTEGMVAKIPVLDGVTDTVTIMTHGYNPNLATWSPFHGAVYAIVESLAKITACGGNYKSVRLSLQEYFEKLKTDSLKWGKPLAGLLGAYYVQNKLEIPAIGGKDSMSGTFKDIHVPPTVVSFAVTTESVQNIISGEFKKVGNNVVYIPLPRDEYDLPKFDILEKNYSKIQKLIINKDIISAYTVKEFGPLEAVAKMSFGNKLGVKLNDLDLKELSKPAHGGIVVEIDDHKKLNGLKYIVLGTVEESPYINDLSIEELIKIWQKPLSTVFPRPTISDKKPFDIKNLNTVTTCKNKIATPKVFIPAFPGTNCEVDSYKAFKKAGGDPNVFVLKNLNKADVEYSVKEIANQIKNSQIIMFPGGFSAGDEPEGSGKFIAAIFRNPYIEEAVMDLLNNRDGLVLGICNGFQALVKLGLLPYGKIGDMQDNSPTLTFNTIGHHLAHMVNTEIVSNRSPWLRNVKVGDIHTLPISHGEGRFYADEENLKLLIENDQIATRYIGNPNGSVFDIEGITSKDGRILGKMAHSERIGKDLYKNIYGEMDQKIFESGINYFK